MGKAIICGGRNYSEKDGDFYWVEDLATNYNITEIVCGMAPGADAMGQLFAKRLRLPVRGFPADWDKHGRAAGPIRNRQMAEYADIVIAFPGGRGTASMINEAQRLGLRVFARLSDGEETQ